MYGIFTYIWLICMVNVGKYIIHGWYGYGYDVSGHCCGISRVFRNPPLGIHLPRCSGAKSNIGSTKSGGSTDLPVNCCLVRGTLSEMHL